MDWNYLSSVSPEDLTEEEKDDLYNTVTWFNCDSENLDQKKCVRLIKISQEILKYKGEQVEILLHKLDELATQQGEEEVRKTESDTDARSSKSRKSSSIEFENLEQKYLDLKNKFKKQLRSNEKNATEIAKLQKKVAALEQEKTRLLNELQLANQGDDHSDVSETVKEQHKELVSTVHNKNKQISELLRDIEVTEKENIILREKLTTVRDELAGATKELTMLTDNFKASKIELGEASENVKKLTAENENLQDEMRDILEQKHRFEQEMEEFTEEVNVRVDEWKKILEEREKEIIELRSRQVQSSHHSSLSSLSQEKEHNQIMALNRVLAERESQLLDVKTQLQAAVKEMEEATTVINKLKEDKSVNERKVEDLSESVKELKKQLKATHERCQVLQEDLAYSEKLVESKDADVKQILEKLKEEGQVNLSENLKQIQQLKGQNRVQEKQIINLVKAANKLQDLSDQYEKENETMRDKLGIVADEIVNTSGTSFKQKQQKRELSSLKRQVQHLEEEKLQLKMEVHKLSRTLSTFSDHSKESEEKPDTDRSQDSQISVKKQVKALVEENEALRKGMHEILDSLNNRKESSLKELKSETFEKLLRALDVKHISGWYHPAMRLQAELHNQEGINSELREQLRLARLELQLAKKTEERDYSGADVVDSSILLNNTIDMITINNIHQTLQDIFAKIEQESTSDQEIEKKLLSYKTNFLQIREQSGLLYKEYLSEKQSLVDKMSEYEERIMDLEETIEVKEKKLSLLIKESPEEPNLVSKSLELAENNVILIRKRSYLENEIKRLTSQTINLQNDLTNAQAACLKKISNLSLKNKTLTNAVDVLNNQVKFLVDPSDYNESRHNMEALTVKYRELLANFSQVERDKEFEIKMFEEIRKNLQQEKAELENKVLSLCEKLHSHQRANESVNEDVESLAKKLAASEASEISERQRANHTNNLFELVKEQLQKSEDRFKQVDKYNKEVLQKNLVLQEQLKDAENKLVSFIDSTTYKALQSKYNESLQTNDKLNGTISELKEQVATVKDSSKLVSHWNSEKEQEILHLKHQVVDLQAVSDEKMQIARLSSELAHCRLQEAECNRKMENLTAELQECSTKCDELSRELQRKCSETAENEGELKKKVRSGLTYGSLNTLLPQTRKVDQVQGLALITSGRPGRRVL